MLAQRACTERKKEMNFTAAIDCMLNGDYVISEGILLFMDHDTIKRYKDGAIIPYVVSDDDFRREWRVWYG